MATISFNAEQQQIINAPIPGSLFIEGPGRSGKTTAAVARLDRILHDYSGYQVLILVPQQSLGAPYRQFISQENNHHGSVPTVTTLAGLLRELTRIFWPLVGPNCGFSSPHDNPNFLSLETAQYCMAHLVRPLLEKGYFQSITIEPNRLFSQIIDNLNKSAIHGLDLEEIGKRLTLSSTDPSTFASAFSQVQECAVLFRKFCLSNNLIDYSLLLQIANDYLLQNELCEKYLFSRYRVLIADNIEEDTPHTHAFINSRLNSFESATLIFDHDGGFRTFLGADADSAFALKENCQNHIHLSDVINEGNHIRNFRTDITSCISKDKIHTIRKVSSKDVEIRINQFLPEMIDDVTNRISELVHGGVQPENIAVLSPFLSDSLKYSLVHKLDALDIPSFSSRPSRKYISSPAIKSLLTLAKLAHPDWMLPATHFEFRDLIMCIIPDLDIIRAEHAARLLFSSRSGKNSLRAFDEITSISHQETITFANGEKLTALYDWLEKYIHASPYPLDLFMRMIFGELLSQPGFAFNSNFEAANQIDQLIQSIRYFRLFAVDVFGFEERSVGKEYLKSIQQGLIPSSFHSEKSSDGCVFIAPAHTFLMQNRNVDYQFWLDIGGLGWWERLYQPLTNPYVFRSSWKKESIWDLEKDFITNQNMMRKLINGLLLRCKKGLIASVIQTNEFGAQNKGPLLQAFQTYLKRKNAGMVNRV